MIAWIKEAWAIAASIPGLVSLMSKIVDWAEKTISEYKANQLRAKIEAAEKRATQDLDQRGLQDLNK